MNKYIIILLITIISSCSGMQNLPKDRSATEPVKVPYSITQVKIVDLRKDVTAADWRLPVSSIKQNEQTISPAIEGELRQGLLGMIQDASTSGAPAATATLYVEEGYYRVTGDWKSATEQTSFKCRIDFAEQSGGNVSSLQSDLSYEYNSIAASEKHVKRLFELTARNCVYDALKEAGN